MDTGLKSYGVTRRTTRNSQLRDFDRINHLQQSDLLPKRIGEFSDEDDLLLSTKKAESVEKITIVKRRREFGGVVSALFLIFSLPLTLIAFHITCNEYNCSFLKLPNLQKYKLLSTYFNTTSTLAFLSYVLVLALLSVIPFGGKKIAAMPSKQGKFIYIMNGFFICILLLLTALGFGYYKYNFSDFIIKNLFQFTIMSIICGFLLSIFVYVHSFYVHLSALNSHAIGETPIYSFFVGREINPRLFGKLDLKMFVFRLTLVTAILCDFAYLYKSLGLKSFETISDFKSLNFHPTLIAFIVIHSIYYLDGLYYETTWITSFEIQYEGFGYIGTMGYFVFPFISVLSTKYIYEHNINYEFWKLAFIAVVFIAGFLLYRLSNNQKDAFRKNPYDSSLAHLETIPTSAGKKLLVSGYWGTVRHPNYLGDIIIQLCFTSFIPWVPPVIFYYVTILFLLHRTVRDNARCKQKYGTAWDRYCSKVKYVLIPKIY